jgi:hypothetical protein
MKRDRVLIFTKILYVLFAVGTAITMVIVYSDMDGSMAYKFVLGYVFLAFFMLLYIPIVTIINSRKMRWTEIGRKMLKFLGLFILISILNFGFDYLIRPSDIDAFRIFSSALGVSFGITFIDVVFLKKKESLKESVSK